MASRLHLYFDDIGGKTTTLIGGGKEWLKDDIVFYNRHQTKDLTIDFVPPDAFLDGNDVAAPSIHVPAHSEKTLKIQKGNPPAKEVRVKYTATLTGCTPEDPIVIIEK